MASKTTKQVFARSAARAVRLVLDHEKDHPSRWATVSSIAAKIGCTAQTLHQWVGKAERDSGRKPGLTTDMVAKLKTLERENRELRQADEILRKASAYFGGGANCSRRPIARAVRRCRPLWRRQRPRTPPIRFVAHAPLCHSGVGSAAVLVETGWLRPSVGAELPRRRTQRPGQFECAGLRTASRREPGLGKRESIWRFGAALRRRQGTGCNHRWR